MTIFWRQFQPHTCSPVLPSRNWVCHLCPPPLLSVHLPGWACFTLLPLPSHRPLTGASASLTTVVCTSTTATAQQQRVVRRDAGTPDAGTPDAAIVRNNANLTPRDSAWVEHCTEYQCFCSTDSNGDPWDPDTRCQKNCDVDGNKCECVYLGCDCETGKNVMKTQSKCKTCKDGFVVIGNHCYLDSDMPVAVNIILGLGIVSFVSLLLTCIALGNMDPGYDSIIYRMTQQRIKSQ